MAYFRRLPNIQYENFLSDSSGSKDYIEIKNIFLRGKLRDDLQNNFTVFTKYEIGERERPDQIAEKLYGDPGLDWIVLTASNIINYQNEFPLTSQQLINYLDDKYGKLLNEVRFWQTTEVRDSAGRLILDAGLVVDSDFKIPNPDFPGSELNPVEGISNFEYENDLNDKKKTIYVLRPEYVNQYIKDMRDLSTYGFNSEFITKRIIRTENVRNQIP